MNYFRLDLCRDHIKLYGPFYLHGCSILTEIGIPIFKDFDFVTSKSLDVSGISNLELVTFVLAVVDEITELYHPCQITIPSNVTEITGLPGIVSSEAKETQ